MSFRVSDIPRLPGTKWSFTSFTLAAFFSIVIFPASVAILTPSLLSSATLEKANAVHPALLHPGGQLAWRFALGRVQDAHAGEAVGVLGGPIGRIAIVILVRAVRLHEHRFVDADLDVE